jgi:3-methylcrotonyl-CoA carboxylase alpha subunit
VAEIAVSPLGNGAYQVVEGSRSRVAYAAGSAEACWVFLDGQVYLVDVAGSPTGVPPANRKKRDEHTALTAPMPATVLAITAQPGQRVSQGDVLIVLEAMKMELPVKSPRDATVKAVICRPGELVQPGVPLLELE